MQQQQRKQPIPVSLNNKPSLNKQPDLTSPVRADNDPPGDPRINESPRLQDTQRRRLSVSTVKREQNTDVTSSRPPTNFFGPAPGTCLSTSKSTDTTTKSTDTSNSLLTTVTTTEPLDGAGGPTALRKYDDPALELIDESTGAIRPVTLEMLTNLVKGYTSSLFLFGTPSENTQRGFDNKKQEVFGTRATEPLRHVGYACKKGLKPESPNQDDFFILQVDDWAMYGVFDGHGPNGHDVSSFVQTLLPFLIISDNLFESDPVRVLKRSFKKAHHLLEALTEATENPVDCTLSGTTATIVLHRGDKLYVAHVGDSHGVLASKAAGTAQVKAVSLTTDHKPTRTDERARIEAAGGEIRRLEGDIPYRVFVKHRLYPGLAMSRALGDTVGASVGVIPDPDIHVVDVTPDVAFVIIATDGVWEFISSQEAVDFVCRKSKDEVQKAAEFLAYESWRRWVDEEENVVDDVTCLIIWLDRA